MGLQDGERCTRCGWPYPGFHVCVDLSVPHPEEGLLQPKKAASSRPRNVGGNRSTTASQTWAKKNKIRDEKIIELYKTGEYGMTKVAQLAGCSQTTVVKVLGRAAAAGEVTLRRRHYTIKTGAV